MRTGKKWILSLFALTLGGLVGLFGCGGQIQQPTYELSLDTVYAMAEEAGYTGTLEELIEMFKGDSAYELAVAGGYTGTEAEWLATLVGATGAKGETGAAGTDGVTPHIGSNGNWYIGNTDTGVRAEGTDGKDGSVVTIGSDGYWYIDGVRTEWKVTGEKGQDGLTPYIGTDGYWYIGEDSTGVRAEGSKVEISPEGTWVIDGEDTGVSAVGQPGQTGATGADGATPYIGSNGNWWIGNNDTDVPARGENGKDGSVVEVLDGYLYIDGVNTGYAFGNGSQPAEAELFDYYPIKEGEETVAYYFGIGRGRYEPEIRVPSSYQGLPVIGIAYQGLAGLFGQKVYLPASVREFDRNACLDSGDLSLIFDERETPVNFAYSTTYSEVFCNLSYEQATGDFGWLTLEDVQPTETFTLYITYYDVNESYVREETLTVPAGSYLSNVVDFYFYRVFVEGEQVDESYRVEQDVKVTLYALLEEPTEMFTLYITYYDVNGTYVREETLTVPAGSYLSEYMDFSLYRVLVNGETADKDYRVEQDVKVELYALFETPTETFMLTVVYYDESGMETGMQEFQVKYGERVGDYVDLKKYSLSVDPDMRITENLKVEAWPIAEGSFQVFVEIYSLDGSRQEKTLNFGEPVTVGDVAAKLELDFWSYRWNVFFPETGESFEAEFETTIDSACQIVAEQILSIVEVTFDANGGQLENGESTMTVEIGRDSGISLPQPVQEGRIFNGWQDEYGNDIRNLEDLFNLGRDSVTLTAVWGYDPASSTWMGAYVLTDETGVLVEIFYLQDRVYYFAVGDTYTTGGGMLQVTEVEGGVEIQITLSFNEADPEGNSISSGSRSLTLSLDETEGVLSDGEKVYTKAESTVFLVYDVALQNGKPVMLMELTYEMPEGYDLLEPGSGQTVAAGEASQYGFLGAALTKTVTYLFEDGQKTTLQINPMAGSARIPEIPYKVGYKGYWVSEVDGAAYKFASDYSMSSIMLAYLDDDGLITLTYEVSEAPALQAVKVFFNPGMGWTEEGQDITFQRGDEWYAPEVFYAEEAQPLRLARWAYVTEWDEYGNPYTYTVVNSVESLFEFGLDYVELTAIPEVDKSLLDGTYMLQSYDSWEAVTVSGDQLTYVYVDNMGQVVEFWTGTYTLQNESLKSFWFETEKGSFHYGPKWTEGPVILVTRVEIWENPDGGDNSVSEFYEGYYSDLSYIEDLIAKGVSYTLTDAQGNPLTLEEVKTGGICFFRYEVIL